MLAEHFDASPKSLTEAQVRDYFLFLRQEKGYSPGSMNQAKVALRVYYRDYLKQKPRWGVFEEVIVRSRETLPVVITREEVRLLLRKISQQRFFACLSLIYACGLRLSEAVAVEVDDIETKAGRLHVRKGKGGKARYVPISADMIEILRAWWKFHRHPKFLFPGLGRRWKTSQRANPATEEHMRRQAMHVATQPMSACSVQAAVRWAVAASGLRRRVTVHTLRHCYATHLLESGISIRHISAYLGHASLNQTLIYAHLSAVGEERTQEVLRALHAEVIEPKPTNKASQG